MSEPRTIIEDQAIGWIIRMRDPAFAGWEAFTRWLEEDPVHASVYDEMALADADVPETLPAPPPPAPPVPRPANDEKPVRQRPRWATRRGAIGWAVAASLVAVVGYSSLVPGTAPYAVESIAGERRSVTLADGSRIELNGVSKVMLDRERPRFARLESGEALFTVVHDSARPFTVEAGDATLVDAGTAFDVIRADGVTQVAVSEGVVIYNPKGENVRLVAGKTLRAADAGEQVSVGTIDPGVVAAWRQGRLIYTAAPLSAVAADLARNLGIPVSAAPGVAARPFSGVIRIDGDRESLRGRVGALLGVDVRRAGNGWVLQAGGDAAR